MFCSNCGTKVEDEAAFCQSCGKRIPGDKTVKIEGNYSSEEAIKNYSPVFWRYFWVGVLLNIFSRGIEVAGSEGFWVIFLILAVIYVYKFSAIINEAMLSIGRKNWWPLGLLSFIPFGFWVAFLIVRAKLKPHGKWVSKHRSFKMSKGL
jgi:hypothetical protein